MHKKKVKTGKEKKNVPHLPAKMANDNKKQAINKVKKNKNVFKVSNAKNNKKTKAVPIKLKELNIKNVEMVTKMEDIEETTTPEKKKLGSRARRRNRLAAEQKLKELDVEMVTKMEDIEETTTPEKQKLGARARKARRRRKRLAAEQKLKELDVEMMTKSKISKIQRHNKRKGSDRERPRRASRKKRKALQLKAEINKMKV